MSSCQMEIQVQGQEVSTRNMITEVTAGRRSIWGSRNGSVMEVRGHPHSGVGGRERIFKGVKERPERLE